MNRSAGFTHRWLPQGIAAWVAKEPVRLVAILAACLALLIKLWLAASTYGTNDVKYFERFLAGYDIVGGVGLYRHDELFNHPPFVIHALRGIRKLAQASGIGFAFWLRLPGILADLGSVWLVYRLCMRQRPRDAQADVQLADTPARAAAIALMALSPVSIMISGFHGNTDSVMTFLLLLSVDLLERGRRTALGGAALGLAMNIKVLPVIVMPAVFLSLRSWGQRWICFAAAAAVFLGGSLPYLLQDPWIIWRKVFGYGSIYGHWGLTRLTTWLPPALDGINCALEQYGRYGVVGAIVLVSLWLNRLPHRPRLFDQIGLLLSLLLTLTTGFGVQYLAWLVPWATGLGLPGCLIAYLPSSVFLFLVYTYWCGGLPWYFADSDTVGGWRGYIVGFELLAWASIAVLASWWLLRMWQLRAGRTRPDP